VERRELRLQYAPVPHEFEDDVGSRGLGQSRGSTDFDDLLVPTLLVGVEDRPQSTCPSQPVMLMASHTSDRHGSPRRSADAVRGYRRCARTSNPDAAFDRPQLLKVEFSRTSTGLSTILRR